AITLFRDLHEALGGISPILGVDQEGGLVDRLDDGNMGATRFPSPAILARAGADSVYRSGRIVGRELHALGITMSFAPVADLGGEGSFIGTRAFGSEPEEVADLVAAFVEGQASTGVASVLKHFPGHGASPVDTHNEVLVREISRDDLENRDLLPFRRGLESGAAGILAGHIVLPNLDSEELPASISPQVLQLA